MANTYTVVRGDTLDAIARRFSVPGGYQELARQNGIPNPDQIQPGQVLNLPPYDAPAPEGSIYGMDPTLKKVLKIGGAVAGAGFLAWLLS